MWQRWYNLDKDINYRLNNLIYKYEIAVLSLERFLKMTTLDEFLSFENDTGWEGHLYELRCFKDCKEPTKLADFGFDLELYGRIWPSLPAFIPFPHGKRVEEVLSPLLDGKFQKHVRELQFIFPMPNGEKWDDEKSQRWIEVHGDPFVIIPPDPVNKTYTSLNAVFSQSP